MQAFSVVCSSLVFEDGSEGQGTRLDVEAFGITALALSMNMKINYYND